MIEGKRAQVHAWKTEPSLTELTSSTGSPKPADSPAHLTAVKVKTRRATMKGSGSFFRIVCVDLVEDRVRLQAITVVVVLSFFIPLFNDGILGGTLNNLRAQSDGPNATIVTETMALAAEATAVTMDYALQLCALQAACGAQGSSEAVAAEAAVNEEICSLVRPDSQLCSFNASGLPLLQLAQLPEAREPIEAWVLWMVLVGAATLLGNSTYHSPAWLPLSLAAAIAFLVCIQLDVGLSSLRESAQQTWVATGIVNLVQIGLLLFACLAWSFPRLRCRDRTGLFRFHSARRKESFYRYTHALLARPELPELLELREGIATGRLTVTERKALQEAADRKRRAQFSYAAQARELALKTFRCRDDGRAFFYPQRLLAAFACSCFAQGILCSVWVSLGSRFLDDLLTIDDLYLQAISTYV